jgi:hydroxymethylpyrimidine/phosphomethylpyrimidine kinase
VFTDDELRAVARQLGAAITVMTPNAAEAAALAGATIGTLDEAVAAGRAIAERYGTVAVLVKGGHWGVDAIDVLATAGACWTFAGPRLPIAVPVHGTGCALSTALACELARGATVLEAVRRAKAYVAARIAAPVLPGHGRPAVL